jgi:hypothetical protein
MIAQSDDSTQVAIRTRMKGAIVKVLEKAKREPKPGDKKRFPRAGGYVSLAQSGLKKMFMTDAWWVDRPRLDVGDPAPDAAGHDPVKLVAFAVNALGPASYRAAIFGLPVTVRVEDEATADVMRAALQLSCIQRPTNHLIRIKVRGDA